MPRRAIAVLLVLASCTYTSQMSVQHAGVPGRTVNIEEFTTVDGETHDCKGAARLPVALRPGAEVEEQRRFDACQAQRRTIAAEAGAMTDADQRAGRLATMPDCTGLQPGRAQAVVIRCAGAVDQVLPAAEVRTLGIGRIGVGTTVLAVASTLVLLVLGALIVAISGTTE